MSESLSEETLDRTYSEVIDHMKRNGIFDDIRVRLTNAILDDEKFSDIIIQFEQECERFCKHIDLTKSRNYLRSKLAECLDSNNGEAALQLEKHIKNFLKERENDLRKEYNHHAGEFLKKFIPDLECPPDTFPPKLSPTAPKESIQKSPTPPITRITPSPQTKSDEDMDLGSDNEEVPEAPAYSPVSEHGELNENPSETKQECDSIDVKQQLDEQNNHDVELTKDDCNVLDSNHDQNHTGDLAKANDDADADGDVDGDGDDDDNVSLDIDDVSSVRTADLSNFDDFIEVSDDEANLLGVPKKFKIPVERLAGDIENLKQTNTIAVVEPCDVPIPPIDPPPPAPPQPVVEQSDSSNSSRNPPRNRKSNSRYINDDFRWY